MKLEEATTKYLNWASASYGRDTLRRKIRTLQRFILYCQIPLEDLTIDYVLTYFNSLDVSPEVLFRTKLEIKLFLKFLAETEVLVLPYSLIKHKNPLNKPTVPITFEEFQVMSDWCMKKYETGNKTYLRWWAIINTLFYTGCRRSELKIPLGNVDLVNNIILIKCCKHEQYKQKKIFFDLKIYLDAYKPKEYLFDMSGNAIAEIVHRLCENCEINKPLHPHSFRAGLITFLSRKGWPVQQIAEYMGQTVNVTQGYIENSSALLLDKMNDTFRKQKSYTIQTDRVCLSLKINNK